ncbi:piggyBac transposable element-derived protein 3-like [Toxorhynchites rutilus septentrionalis]|uniref:piggyBac transposable element-derived protein 3-like n=1 Tax=Toxorhynchites rutilus septentrionalis TaxID=329112 RepID=UPI002479FF77|nr:piggyBac transposable element-derived protein 3-like [Toxorhynchites rutilus septentrionalis]
MLIATAIPRNKFEQIMKYLHFNDNLLNDGSGKLFKVQPLIEHANDKILKMGQPLGKHFSIDEAMEPYYGRNSIKQFIRGKPIRFGYKFWCLCTHDGCFIKFIPYEGKTDRDPGEPLGSKVVSNLSKDIVAEESYVHIDNFFTSLALLEDFGKRDINIIGTIRNNRIEKATLESIKKQARGSYDIVRDTETNITIVRWNDNNVVIMATSVKNDNIVLREERLINA